MFNVLSLALVALAALSVVSGAPLLVARHTPPAGWNAAILESYDDYYTRYHAIDCQDQHNTQFFADCCHPMKKGETLQNNRKAYCSPGAGPSPSSTPATVSPPANTLSPNPVPTSVPDGEDDCEDDGNGTDDGSDDDDDDCDDEPESPSPVPSTPAPVPTPSPDNSYPTPTLSPYDTDPTPTPSPDSDPTPYPDNTDPTPTPSPPAPSPSPDGNTPSQTFTGGEGTWFTQNGVAGACGTVHSDSDFIVAVDSDTYGDTGAVSSYCGKTISISWQGKSVNAVVADACPTCANSASLDLSVALFQYFADLSVGVLEDISWSVV